MEDIEWRFKRPLKTLQVGKKIVPSLKTKSKEESTKKEEETDKDKNDTEG